MRDTGSRFRSGGRERGTAARQARQARQGGHARLARPGASGPADHAARPRPDLPAHDPAGAGGRPQANQHPSALDHGCLRLHARRLPHHHGHAGRPDRTAQAVDDRGGVIRRRLGVGRLFDQRRNADRGARGPRRGGGNADALDAGADQQSLRRPTRARLGLRHMGDDLRGRLCARPRPRRLSLGTFVVGRRLPARGARRRRIAPARALSAARLSRAECRTDRSSQRGDLARRHAAGDLWHQANRQIWHRARRHCGDRGGPFLRRRLRASAEQAVRPAHRYEPVRQQGVFRRAHRAARRAGRGRRDDAADRAISPARGRLCPFRRGPLDGPGGARHDRRRRRRAARCPLYPAPASSSPDRSSCPPPAI